MKTTRSKLIAASVLLLGSFMIGFCGCSADQIEKSAQDIQYVTGTSTTKPTSQPAALNTALDVGKTGAQITAATVPGASSILWMIGTVAGVVSTIAVKVSGKSTQTAQTKTTNNIITEIYSDVVAFKNPAVPWTASAAKLLGDLGLETTAQS